MPLYTKRLQVKIEDWMEEYLDAMMELHEHTEPELVRLLMALGAGTLEARLMGKDCDKFFDEIGIPIFKDMNDVVHISNENKHKFISRAYFIARQYVEERMKTLRK